MVLAPHKHKGLINGKSWGPRGEVDECGALAASAPQRGDVGYLLHDVVAALADEVGCVPPDDILLPPTRLPRDPTVPLDDAHVLAAKKGAPPRKT